MIFLKQSYVVRSLVLGRVLPPLKLFWGSEKVSTLFLLSVHVPSIFVDCVPHCSIFIYFQHFYERTQYIEWENKVSEPCKISNYWYYQGFIWLEPIPIVFIIDLSCFMALHDSKHLCFLLDIHFFKASSLDSVIDMVQMCYSLIPIKLRNWWLMTV